MTWLICAGTAFTNFKADKVYPSVGMKKPNEHIRVNFGRTPFVFDIDGMVEKERGMILEEISAMDVRELHPPDDENSLVRNLVQQYLAHEGYVETAKLFGKEWRDRQGATATSISEVRGGEEDEEDDDIHAINRQKIRRAILDGDIDRALKFTNSYYPRLWDEERNRDVYFRLRVRKFVEMIRRSADNSGCGAGASEVSSSDEEEGEDGEGDTQMELDGQLRDHQDYDGEDVDMDVSGHESLGRPPGKGLRKMRKGELEQAALRYGAELQDEFGGDERGDVQRVLRESFAVLAYGHWSDEGFLHRGLFERGGRVGVAEGVNGAILGESLLLTDGEGEMNDVGLLRG